MIRVNVTLDPVIHVTEHPETIHVTVPTQIVQVTGTDLAGPLGLPGPQGLPGDDASVTPDQIMAVILEHDGAGSGVDADTWRGYEPGFFAPEAQLTELAGTWSPIIQDHTDRIGAIESADWFLDQRVDALEAASPATVAAEALAAHVVAPTPHPVYDDMADLTLIYENHLV